MEKINLKTLINLLPDYQKLRIPLYLWGKPSSGKTSIVRQFAEKKAKDLGLEYSETEFGKDLFTLKIITLSQFDAPDLRGMPELIGKGETRRTQFVPTKELPREGQGIIFFDEMNLADDTVRAACYQFILEGRYSNIPCLKVTDKNGKEKDAFWRVAASNTEQDYSGVNQTGLALLRRFCHFQVEPEVDEIVNYFLEQGKDSRIIAYLKNAPEDLFPKKWDETLLDRKANPFPYTWEVAANLIEGKKVASPGMAVTMGSLVASCVGPEVAGRFIAFCKTIGKFDVEGFIRKPKEEVAKIEKDNERASLFYALISSLASWWFQKNKKLKAKKVIEISQELPAEFSVAFLKMIVKKRTRELTDIPGFQRLLRDLGVYFDEV